MAGKKYNEAKKLVDRSKLYSYTEAIELAKKTNVAKFDASVEVSFSVKFGLFTIWGRTFFSSCL